MTVPPTETVVDAARSAEAAAAAVARTITLGEPLSVGPVGPAQPDPELPQAVLAAVEGAVGGEIAIFVDEELVHALQGSALGALDLAAALAPSLEESARMLGSVVVGIPQVIDARLAHSRIAAHARSAGATLSGAFRSRAAVAVGLDGPPAGAASPAHGAPGPERLDLLRGVEMAATVELGRARMTINELLSLRDGTVIELDRAAGDAADLYVNGRLLARGEVVVVDENYGLRITQIVTDAAGH